MKYYDEKNKRLVFISSEANESYWDDQWQSMIASLEYSNKLKKRNLFLNITQKYCPMGSTILEGGCGLAQNSWNNYIAGYKTIALDYTPKTIEFLKHKLPEVNPILGDVRKLELEDNSIDGYWSFGVIEHFYDGYDEILKEGSRVIKKGGYFFVTFPHMSKIRRWKAQNAKYPIWNEDEKLKKDFYQFALDEKQVIEDMNFFGFELIESKPFDGIGGYRREMKIFKKYLDKIYSSPFIANKVIKKMFDMLFSSYFSHSIILVFRKVK